MEEDSNAEIDNLIEGYESVDDFAQNAFSTIVTALKAGNGLPRHGDDFDFYSSFDGFRKFCHQNGEKTLQIIRQIIGNQMMTNALTKSSLNLEIEDKLEALIDANDSMIEKVGMLLDEASGSKPKTLPLLVKTKQDQADVSIASWNKKNTESTQQRQSFHMMYAKNTTRPQLKFEEKVDNSNVPFRPIIRHKPNALKPLVLDQEQKFQSVQEFIAQQREEVETGKPADSAPHPYQYEIETFEPDDSFLEVEEGYRYQPVDETPLTFVSTSKQLEDLSHLLKNQKAFAVDLEHHSYRSFQGFTCLMQISTRDQDYIVDTLDLRNKLHILNESFTDPKIVKIFHGAGMDVEWLQRDFGIYVVNLFDTGEASKLLGLARNSLAFLLKHYCNVETDKKYQLADWRIRPLPEAMKMYAREDTHYLLYIYNKMKEDLINLGNNQKNLLKAVFQRSKTIALRKYHKPLFTNVSYMALYKKNRKSFSPKQIHAFRLLYAWRDSIAREEDESTGYVLPNHMLFQIAEHLPRESSGVLACCNPVPPLVMQHVTDIHRLIVQARNYSGKSEIHVHEDSELAKSKSEEVTFTSRVVDPLESILHCPHDLSPQEDTQDSHADLSQHHDSLSHQATIEITKPKIKLFGDDPAYDVIAANKDKVARIKAAMLNPFQMYLPSSRGTQKPVQRKPTQVSSGLLDSDKIAIGDDGKKYIKSSPYVWKVKHGQKEGKPPAASNHSNQEVPSTVKQKEPLSDGEVDDEEQIPLRSMKRKKAFAPDQRKIPHPTKKSKKDIVDQIPDFGSGGAKAGFQPFNYKTATHQRFTDQSHHPEESSKRPQGRGRKRYFKAPQRSNIHPRAGQKSMSFSQAGRSSRGKGRHSFPKR